MTKALRDRYFDEQGQKGLKLRESLSCAVFCLYGLSRISFFRLFVPNVMWTTAYVVQKFSVYFCASRTTFSSVYLGVNALSAGISKMKN